VFTLPSFAGCAAAVRAGLGFAVMPEAMVPKGLVVQHGLVVQRISRGLAEAEIALLGSARLSPAAAAVARFIGERVRRWPQGWQQGPLRLQVPHPRSPFDGGGVQAVDLQFLAHFLEHPQFHFAQASIGGSGITGQRVGGFVQPFGKAIADQAEQGGKAVFLFKQVIDRLSDDADAIDVVFAEYRHRMHHALDRHHFRGAQLRIGGRGGNHHRHKGILWRQRGGNIWHGGTPVVAAQNIDLSAVQQ